MTAAMEKLLSEVEQLHRANPVLQNFAPWPDDLYPKGLMPRHFPVTEILCAEPLSGTEQTQPVLDRLADSTSDAFWTLTYTEEEVGADFLRRYGYFELYGPTGHFHSDTARGYLAYWGGGLFYDWHRHEAEEMYLCLSGGALFHAEGADDRVIGPGDTRLHTANQPHAMTTTDTHILAYIVWRGAGIAGVPKMGRVA